MRRQVACAWVLSIALAASISGAAGQPTTKKGLVTGWSGGVVSPTVTSVYIGGHRGTRVGPLVLVYFHGQPGWHRRQWKNHFLQNQSPGGVTLTGEQLVLKVEADIDNETAIVQDQTFARAENNVFLVVHADRPDAQRVVALGRYELPVDQPKLALYLLETHPALGERIAAETGQDSDNS